MAGDDATKIERALKPQDAATLIVIDRSGLPRVLMGRRRPTQVFLPNKFVFPGGRADTADRSVPAASELRRPQEARLLLEMKGGAATAPRARGLALAALRETYEEAGLLIGQAAGQVAEAPAADLADEAWRAFFAAGVRPALAPLTYLARAITPPGRPRRYDTRFFLVDSSFIVRTAPPPDDELSELGWFTLEELRRLDLPNITRAVLEDLNEYLEHHRGGPDDWPVPFYYFKSGAFERVLLR